MAKRPKSESRSQRIVIVTRSFYPTNTPRANRATELAKEFSRQGHKVTVLTPSSEDQAELRQKFGIEIVDLGKRSWPVPPLSWRGRFKWLFRGIRRAMWITLCYPDIELAFQCSRRVPSIPSADLLISIAAPHAVHWGVALAHWRNGLPATTWIADCGDPFMGAENDSFRPAYYFRWVEKFFCRRADWLTVPTEGSRGGYYAEFQDKIVVIPQGFKFEEYEHLRTNRPTNKIPMFAYAGHIIPGRRDPKRLIEFLSNRVEPFEFHIFTKLSESVRPYSECDPRIVIHEFLPRMDLLAKLADMDFLVNIENVGETQTPSKLIDYWLCGRPILSVKSHDLPIASIEQFIRGDYSNALTVPEPDQYRIENVVRRFLHQPVG